MAQLFLLKTFLLFFLFSACYSMPSESDSCSVCRTSGDSDEDCQCECKCDLVYIAGQAVCRSPTCKPLNKGEYCEVVEDNICWVNGVSNGKACAVLKRGKGKGSGDPHYETFDGLQIDYNGPCSYILATNKCPNHKLNQPFFEIQVQHRKCGKRQKNLICVNQVILRVTHTKFVNEENIVEVIINSRNKVKIDGNKVNLPLKHLLFNISQIRDQHQDFAKVIHISTEFGSIRYTKGTVKVSIDKKIRTCGLLGNNNGDAKDDLMFKNGTIIDLNQNKISKNLLSQWGDTWFVHDKNELLRCKMYPQHSMISLSQCEFDIKQVHNYCDKMLQAHYKNLHAKQVNKCFKHSIINANDIYEDCITEICACKKSSISLCQPNISINKFAEICRQNGVNFTSTSWTIV